MICFLACLKEFEEPLSASAPHPRRAMICFLACLKEFGEHAAREDVMHSRHPPFAFPFPLDGDKVRAQAACMSEIIRM